jgi:hypothetical protein
MEYVDRVDELLESSLCREVMADEDKLCRQCMAGNQAIWRCSDCCLGIPMCRGCIRRYHQTNPLHRIEQWNGHFFRPADLWEVGTYLLIRHQSGVTICERLTAQQRFLELIEKRNDEAEQDKLKTFATSSASGHTMAEGISTWADPMETVADPPDIQADPTNSLADDQDETDEEFMRYIQQLRDGEDNDTNGREDTKDADVEVDDDMEDEEVDESTFKRYLPNEFQSDFPIGPEDSGSSAQRIMGSYVRVVHTNGIHNIAMISCECQGHDMLPNDLIAARLLPTSFERIRTLFTAQLLDHSRLCNLELKSSAYHYYHLLQRVTNPMEPAKVVNLYREFRRMSRIWRWMKRLKWAGFGNTARPACDVKAGTLTVFCPACPQPGINIPEDWKKDPARYGQYSKQNSFSICFVDGYISVCLSLMEISRRIMFDKRVPKTIYGSPRAQE